MVIQVLTLMPLRTVMKYVRCGIRTPLAKSPLIASVMTYSYQYRYGGSFLGTARTLYAEEPKGPGRYYAGLAPALVQGPVGTLSLG